MMQKKVEADIQEQKEEEHVPTTTPKAEEEPDAMNEDIEQEQNDQAVPTVAQNPDPKGRISSWKVIDDLMSAWRSHTAAFLGWGLPNIQIFHSSCLSQNH
jgi:hypothetical protein